jgi:hypothetical protein
VSGTHTVSLSFIVMCFPLVSTCPSGTENHGVYRVAERGGHQGCRQGLSRWVKHVNTPLHTHPRVPLPGAVLYWGKVGGWIQVTRQPGGWGAAEQLPPRYKCLCWALKRRLNQASQAGFICSPPAFNYLATHYICFRRQTQAHHPEYTHMEMLVYSRSSISSA